MWGYFACVIKEGMRRTWAEFQSLPDERKAQAYHIPEEEAAFLKQAMTVYSKNKLRNSNSERLEHE